MPVSVNTGKHRWRESNPRNAGLESGSQPLHTGDGPGFGQKKRAACCRYPAQTAPGGLPSRRSSRRTALVRAELVVEGLIAHGSQARRQSHAAGPPGFVQDVRSVHDLSSGFLFSREIVSPNTYVQVNAFPTPIVPTQHFPPTTPKSRPRFPHPSPQPDEEPADRQDVYAHCLAPASRPRVQPHVVATYVLSICSPRG